MTDRNLLPSKDILDSLFEYNPETGELIRKVTTSSNAKKGFVCKNICKKGYIRVRLDGKNRYVHRVIWKMYYNQEPPQVIDHINQNKSDNRINNLRGATLALNQINSKLPKNNSSGVRGICKQRTKNRWSAVIGFNKKTIFLGTFSTYCAAIKARKNAEKFYYNI